MITPSSGNVFEDLGLPRPAEALAKAELSARISDLMDERGLTQAEADRLLRLPQPKVSALVRGNLAGFSFERLFRLLNAAGRRVELVVQKPTRDSPADLRVRAALTPSGRTFSPSRFSMSKAS